MWSINIHKNYPWINRLKQRMLLAFLLFVLVVFILLFLKPFDTGEKNLPNKGLMLVGYGVSILFVDLLLIAAERLVVIKWKKNWTISYEFLYLSNLLMLSSMLVYMYDIAIIKNNRIEWNYFFHFSLQFTMPMALLLLPALGYLRYKNGEMSTPRQASNPLLQLRGQNKGDILNISLHNLICIKAEDNYVRIIYLVEDYQIKELLMRNTLAEMQKQVKTLHYCHRSYLIAPWNIKQLEGHKQKAKLFMKHYNQEIPLSAKYFNKIKESFQLSFHP